MAKAIRNKGDPNDARVHAHTSAGARLRALSGPASKSRRKTGEESADALLALETFIDRELLGDVRTRAQMESILST